METVQSLLFVWSGTLFGCLLHLTRQMTYAEYDHFAHAGPDKSR